MTLRLLLPLVSFVTVAAFAAEAPKLPSIPAEPTAKKKELLFSDDFEKPEMGSAWKIEVPTFSVENGIARATKSKVEFGCMGKDGFFDDLKVWNAEPSGAK